jgi:hypothetical protein
MERQGEVHGGSALGAWWCTWSAAKQGDLTEFRSETLELCGYNEHRVASAMSVARRC